MPESLGSRVKTGYLWTLLGFGLGQPLTFVIGVILARILNPADFGTIAACLAFIEVGSTVVSSSYVSGLVQKREVSARDLSTAFVLLLTTGVGAAILLIAAAPLLGKVLGIPLLRSVLSVLSLNLIVLAFVSPPSAIVRRNLDFRLLMFMGLAQNVTYGAVALGLALADFGVWSLVWGRVVSHAVQAVLFACVTRWVPSFRFSRAAAACLCRVSVQFAGKNILDDLARNVGYLFVGWRLGVEPLGFYSRAHYLMTYPITRLSSSLGNILFPAFSRMPDEKALLVRGLVKSTCLISMTTFPVLVGLQVAAAALVHVAYGPKWMPTVPPLQIICLAGLFYSIDPPAVALINARGYLLDEIKRQVLHLVFLGVFVLWGTRWGTAGVAWGVALAACGYWVLLVRLLGRRIGLSWGLYLEALLPAAAASGGMALAVIGFQVGVRPLVGRESALNLAGSVTVGVLAYPGLLWGICRTLGRPIANEALGEVEALLKGGWNRVVQFLVSRKQWSQA